MDYVYAAVFHICKEGNYSVSFPDLPNCKAEATTLASALTQAETVLAERIEQLLAEKQALPTPTDLSSIRTSGTEFSSFVRASVRDHYAVKRTVSLPASLDEAASKAGLSLSKVLQDALIQKLS